MSTTKAANVGARALSSRAGASRKLLARKAREAAFAALTNVPLESSFPPAASASQVGGEAPSLTHGARRGLSEQKLKLGDMHPNGDTVFATIIGIVAGRGELSRTELLDLMRDSSFPHPAARPQERAWCQGYVAGALRSGFLAVVTERAIAERPATADATQEG